MKKAFIFLFTFVFSLLLAGCKPWFKKKPIAEEVTCEDESGSSAEISDDLEVKDEVDFIESGENADEMDKISIFDDEDSLILDEKDSLGNENVREIDFDEDDNSTESSESASAIDFIEKDKMHLGTFLFEYDIASKCLNESYKDMIDEIAKKVECLCDKGEEVKVIVEGHACNSAGSEVYNQKISCQRATTIKNTLERSLDSDISISDFGLGTSRLLIVKGDRYEQAPNRRVEVFVMTK